jgi:hypothetical protein
MFKIVRSVLKWAFIGLAALAALSLGSIYCLDFLVSVLDYGQASWGTRVYVIAGFAIGTATLIWVGYRYLSTRPWRKGYLRTFFYCLLGSVVVFGLATGFWPVLAYLVIAGEVSLKIETWRRKNKPS